MKRSLQAVAEELRSLRHRGVTHVAVSEATVSRLRGLVEGAAGAVSPVAAGAGDAMPPAPVREPGAGAAGAEERRIPVVPRAEAVPPAVVPRPAPAAVPARAGRAPGPSAGGGGAIPEPVPLVLPEGTREQRFKWLLERVMADPVCVANVRPGKKVVLGTGRLDADILFVGEAPGAEEEVTGEPFVGPAGELLTKMIRAMGLERADVYIGNIMNWRPAMPVRSDGQQVGNRPPTPAEMRYCLPHLLAQVEIVKPRAIVALGKTAAEGLLGDRENFTSLAQARGRWYELAGRPVRVTYHPSYLLRNQNMSEKRKVWEDLLATMERVGLPITEKQRGFFLTRS